MEVKRPELPTSILRYAIQNRMNNLVANNKKSGPTLSDRTAIG
jgi:hypothetical protein